MIRISILLSTLGLLALTSCAKDDANTAPPNTPSQAAVAPAAQGQLPRLVFFLNPNGAPCKAQERILREAASQLEGRVEIVRYSTTHAPDRAVFARYGIRALPTLVVTDANGQELRRGAPGIQSAEQVLELIGG